MLVHVVDDRFAVGRTSNGNPRCDNNCYTSSEYEDALLASRQVRRNRGDKHFIEVYMIHQAGSCK